MISALLTTLGVLIGILVFVVIVIVGIIEIIRGTIGAVRPKKKEENKN